MDKRDQVVDASCEKVQVLTLDELQYVAGGDIVVDPPMVEPEKRATTKKVVNMIVVHLP
jgi:hypothetical protein